MLVRRLHNEKLSDVDRSLIIIRIIKSSVSLLWARILEKKNKYRNFLGKPLGKRLGIPLMKWKVNVTMDVMTRDRVSRGLWYKWDKNFGSSNTRTNFIWFLIYLSLLYI